MSLLFGGDGSYMAPLSLNNDNVITSLMSQVGHPLKIKKEFRDRNISPTLINLYLRFAFVFSPFLLRHGTVLWLV